MPRPESPWTPEKREQAVLLNQDGMTHVQIEGWHDRPEDSLMVEIVPVTMTITAANGEPVTTTVEMTREQYVEFISTPEVQFVRKRQQDRFAEFYRSLSKLDTMPKVAPKKDYFREFMLNELRPQFGVSIPAHIDETGKLYVHYSEGEVFEWNGYPDDANAAGLVRLWSTRRRALSPEKP